MYSSGEDSKFRNGDCDHVMTMGFVIVIIFVTINPEYAIEIIITVE